MTYLPRLRLLSTTLLTLLFITGCGITNRELAGLAIEMEGVRAVRERDGNTEVVVILRYHNETLRPIGIKQMDLKLSINGISLGKITAKRPLGTMAMTSNSQDATFIIKNAGTAESIKAALQTGAINYEIETELMVMSGEEEIFARPSASGSVDVSNLAR
jgi:LEA14-like dessication related protein